MDKASSRTLPETDETTPHPEQDQNQYIHDAERGLDATPSNLDLWRTRTNRLQYEMTVGARSSYDTSVHNFDQADCPSMGNGRTLPSKLANPDNYLVEFDGPDDTLHPFNWKLSTK